MKKDEFIIGSRKDTCHIVLEDPAISRRHCSISRDDHGEYLIQDLKSRNGTFILRDGNKFELTPFQLEKVLRSDNLILGQTNLNAGKLIDDIEERFPAKPDKPEVTPQTKKLRCHCGKIWIMPQVCSDCGMPRWD